MTYRTCLLPWSYLYKIDFMAFILLLRRIRCELTLSCRNILLSHIGSSILAQFSQPAVYQIQRSCQQAGGLQQQLFPAGVLAFIMLQQLI